MPTVSHAELKSIEYSKRAGLFIEEHGVGNKVRDSIRDFIRRITGSAINIDIKKLKGEWAGYYRIRKGKIRIVLKPEKRNRDRLC